MRPHPSREEYLKAVHQRAILAAPLQPWRARRRGGGRSAGGRHHSRID